MLLSVSADLSLFVRAFSAPLLFIAGVLYLLRRWNPAPVDTSAHQWVTLDELLGPATATGGPHAAPVALDPVVQEPEEPAVVAPVIERPKPLRSPVPVLFPKLVSRTQRASGLTWQEFADVVGVSAGTVHRWINGTTPTVTNQHRVERVAQVVDGFTGPREERKALWAQEVAGVTLFDRTQQQNFAEGAPVRT